LRKFEDASGPSPGPLILAGWSAPALSKILRLQEQIQWADKHGALEEAGALLQDLQEEDWHHIGE